MKNILKEMKNSKDKIIDAVKKRANDSFKKTGMLKKVEKQNANKLKIEGKKATLVVLSIYFIFSCRKGNFNKLVRNFNNKK